MKNPVLPTDEQRPLPFFLAMEEWIARQLPPDDYFFAWRVEPTVICGRNQDIEKEVNITYCRKNGINIVRRRSGGGCVYADMNNWMFSYITPNKEENTTFGRYTGMVTEMLRSLGFEASATGRNDIFINMRKVAGNAFYHLPDRSIVHGTMLVDYNAERMANAITPSRAKLESKAVKSVPTHLTCLKAEGLKMTVEDFGAYAVDFLTHGNKIILGSENIAEIESIEQTYYSPSFIAGRHNRNNNSKDSIQRRMRIEGVGEFDISITLDKNRRISSLNITGDFLASDSIENTLINKFTGIEYTDTELHNVIDTLNPETVIRGLNRETLLSLLI